MGIFGGLRRFPGRKCGVFVRFVRVKHAFLVGICGFFVVDCKARSDAHPPGVGVCFCYLVCFVWVAYLILANLFILFGVMVKFLLGKGLDGRTSLFFDKALVVRELEDMSCRTGALRGRRALRAFLSASRWLPIRIVPTNGRSDAKRITSHEVTAARAGRPSGRTCRVRCTTRE